MTDADKLAAETIQYLVCKGVAPHEITPIAEACDLLIDLLAEISKTLVMSGQVRNEPYFIAQAILMMALKTSEVPAQK